MGPAAAPEVEQLRRSDGLGRRINAVIASAISVVFVGIAEVAGRRMEEQSRELSSTAIASSFYATAIDSSRPSRLVRKRL